MIAFVVREAPRLTLAALGARMQRGATTLSASIRRLLARSQQEKSWRCGLHGREDRFSNNLIAGLTPKRRPRDHRANLPGGLGPDSACKPEFVGSSVPDNRFKAVETGRLGLAPYRHLSNGQPSVVSSGHRQA